MQEMEERETALFVFRKLVYLLYLEIGALQPRIHPGIARKARLNTAFFQRDKERQAIELYQQIEHETDLHKILFPFEERTGLTLKDVYRAFNEGDWRNKFGSYNFGGPKWAKIAEVTLKLYRLMADGKWDETPPVIMEIKSLKNSQGYVINQFDRTERRRSA